MTREELAAKIDHTFLKAAGEPDAVKDLCREAAEYGFACAMVNPAEVKNAAKFLKGKNVRVGTVVGFPLGQATAKMKVLEAQEAIKNGAIEPERCEGCAWCRQSRILTGPELLGDFDEMGGISE